MIHQHVTPVLFTRRIFGHRPMILQKTEKARAELKPGTRTLGQRERALLLLVDGRKGAAALNGLFEGQGGPLIERLLNDGFLAIAADERQPTSIQVRNTSSTAETSVRSATQLVPAPVGEETSNQVAADQFEGKRSLATTRMFLFDLAERMFARRDPELANRFREFLRTAKDRESMLAVSREMVETIEMVAGHERADSISERIAMLLPPETQASSSTAP